MFRLYLLVFFLIAIPVFGFSQAATYSNSVAIGVTDLLKKELHFDYQRITNSFQLVFSTGVKYHDDRTWENIQPNTFKTNYYVATTPASFSNPPIIKEFHYGTNSIFIPNSFSPSLSVPFGLGFEKATPLKKYQLFYSPQLFVRFLWGQKVVSTTTFIQTIEEQQDYIVQKFKEEIRTSKAIESIISFSLKIGGRYNFDKPYFIELAPLLRLNISTNDKYNIDYIHGYKEIDPQITVLFGRYFGLKNELIKISNYQYEPY